MNNFYLKAFFFLVLTLFTFKSNAQTLEYELQYNISECRYEAYAHLVSGSLSGSSTVFLSGFFTVMVPASVSNVQFTAITENPVGKSWINNLNVYAPEAAPMYDIHTFKISGAGGTLPSMVAGDVIRLFSFEIPNNGCASGIRVFVNGVDPDSAAPGMMGGDHNQFFECLLVNDIYTQNISNLAITDEGPTAMPMVSCTEDNINLAANASSTCSTINGYSWTGPNGFTSTSATPVIPITDITMQTGLYTVVITEITGCSTTAEIMVDDMNCFPSEPCLVSQYYTGNVFTGVYQTSNVIGSSGLVQNGDNVSMMASCINLDAGFEVELGAEYLADPVPCGN